MLQAALCDLSPSGGYWVPLVSHSPHSPCVPQILLSEAQARGDRHSKPFPGLLEPARKCPSSEFGVPSKSPSGCRAPQSSVVFQVSPICLVITFLLTLGCFLDLFQVGGIGLRVSTGPGKALPLTLLGPPKEVLVEGMVEEGRSS